MADRGGSGPAELSQALLRGDRSAVGELLAAGVPPRMAPLSDPVLVDVLVSAGADVDEATELGDRAIEIAAALGRTAVVKRLLLNGAQVTDASMAAARRRGWTGVEHLLSNQIRSGDLADGLGSGELSSAPGGALRVLAPDRVVSIALDGILVEWEVDGLAVRPSRWHDLDLNQVSWIEPDPNDPGRLLLAGEDEGVVEFDADGWAIVGRTGTDDQGPADRGGVRQVLMTATGPIDLPAGRPSPWIMQVALTAQGAVVGLREGPTTGENPSLELIWPGSGAVTVDSPGRVWRIPDVEAFVPASFALTVGKGHALLHALSQDMEPIAIVVDLGGPEIIDTVTLGGPTRKLPDLQSVVALPDGRFVVLHDGVPVVLGQGAGRWEAQVRLTLEGRAQALSGADGLVAVTSSVGLELLDLTGGQRP